MKRLLLASSSQRSWPGTPCLFFLSFQSSRRSCSPSQGLQSHLDRPRGHRFPHTPQDGILLSSAHSGCFIHRTRLNKVFLNLELCETSLYSIILGIFIQP